MSALPKNLTLTKIRVNEGCEAMALKMVKTLLASRAIREKAGNLKGKIRYMDVKHPITREGEKKNWLDNLGDGFNALTGFITGNGWWGRLFTSTVTGIFNWGMQQITKLVNFDFNQSDKQLLSLMNAQGNRLAAIWGGLAGQALGWTVSIAVGYGVSLVIPVIGGAALAKAVTAGVKLEAGKDVGSGWVNSIVQTLTSFAEFGLVGAYFLARSAINRGKEWQGGNGVWSMSALFENVVNAIPLEWVRTFINSAVDSATESFWEGGIIIAQELDNAFDKAKADREAQRGKRRTVTLKPDRRRAETLILKGDQLDLEEDILATMNNYRLIANRDVGQIVGMPAEDYLSAKPLRRQLTIVFKTKKEPPWKMPNGTQAKQKEVTIPDADLGLTWGQIKLAAKPYTWGKFRATAHLDNGRQMAVYGASKSEAEKTLRRLAALSTAKILALNVTEEVEKKNINLKKEPMTVYPAYATLLVRRPTTGEGRNFTDGTKASEDRIRIDLWPNEAPQGLPPLK